MNTTKQNAVAGARKAERVYKVDHSKTYQLVQIGELFASTNNERRAIQIARDEAKQNRLDVTIEEMRPTFRIIPSGYVFGEGADKYNDY